MTICIAAACRDGSDRKIVVCTDKKLSGALGSSDRAKKDRLLPNRWRCLWSGDEPEFLPIYRLYRNQFKASPIDAASIDQAMQAPLITRKHQLVDEFVQKTFAISQDEFFRFGKERLPPDIFQDAIRQIKDIKLGVELIVVGFIDDDIEIYCTDTTGRARPTTDFAVIGEGEYLAQSVLLRRQQHYFETLERTIYNLYEAKRFAEGVGSVGTTTHLRIISLQGKSKLTSAEIDVQLADLYEAYGPKELPDDLTFKGEYYFESKKSRDNDGS